MAEQAYAYVTLIPVAKGFQSAIAKEMAGVEDIGADTGAKAGKGFTGGFGGSLKTLAVTVGGALAAIGVGRFFGDSIKQSSDLGESINAVNKAYGDYADSVLSLGDDVANRLGLSTVDFNQAAVRFSSFAERVVGQGGDVAGFVDSLTTRAADFASVFNIDVSEALQVFQSGLSGEAEPLKRFGINLLDSEVRAYAMANGIGEVGRELTESEKVQARYGLLLEQTSKTAGDFADTSDGLANSQRILDANITNLQANIGTALVPVLAGLTSAMVPIANEVAPALAQGFANLAPVLTNIGTFLTDVSIPAVLGAFGWIGDNIPTITTFVGVLGTLLAVINATAIATKAWAAVQAVLNAVMAVNPLTIVAVAVAALAAGIVYLATQTTFFQDTWAAMVEFAKMVIAAFKADWDAFVKFVQTTFDAVVKFILMVWKNMSTGIKTGLDAVTGFFKTAWDGVTDFFRGVINGYVNMFESFFNFVIDGANGLIRALNKIRVTIPATAFSDAFTIGVNLPLLSRLNLPRLAEGGFVDEPTTALIGEAGPEVVMPPDEFEKMMGMDQGGGKTVNYYAAPNQSIDAERALFQAMRRAKVVANW